MFVRCQDGFQPKSQIPNAMSYIIEVYYGKPADPAREAGFAEIAISCGGRLDFRDDTTTVDPAIYSAICLAFDFDTLAQAQSAAERFRAVGEHVEGPSDYGP